MSEYLDHFYSDTASRFWSPRQEAPRCRSQKVLEVLDASGVRYSRVLEFGYGSGWLLYRLALRHEHLVGWESNESVARPVQDFLTETGIKNVDLRSGDPPAFEGFAREAGSSFDMIVTEAVVEHMVDLYGTLDSIQRLLRPNGHFCIMLPNVAFFKTRLALLLGRFPRTGSNHPISEWRKWGWDGNHLHVFTKASMTQLLTDCGFEVTRYFGWGARLPVLDPLRDWRPSFFSGALIAMCKKRPLGGQT